MKHFLQLLAFLLGMPLAATCLQAQDAPAMTLEDRIEKMESRVGGVSPELQEMTLEERLRRLDRKLGTKAFAGDRTMEERIVMLEKVMPSETTSADTPSTKGPNYLYLKNNTGSDVFVWVNGEPQGMAPAGVTAMMPREGFVTNDSGVQPDGTVVATHSFGGWVRTETITVKAAGWTYVKNASGGSERELVVWDVPAAGIVTAESAWVWLGEPSMKNLDMEIAVKFQPGQPPSGMAETLPEAVNAPPPGGDFKSAGTRDQELKATLFDPRWSGDGAAKKPKPRGEVLEGTWTKAFPLGREDVAIYTFRSDGTYSRTKIINGNLLNGADYDAEGTYVIEGGELKLNGKITKGRRASSQDVGKPDRYWDSLQVIMSSTFKKIR